MLLVDYKLTRVPVECCPYLAPAVVVHDDVHLPADDVALAADVVAQEAAYVVVAVVDAIVADVVVAAVVVAVARAPADIALVVEAPVNIHVNILATWSYP